MTRNVGVMQSAFRRFFGGVSGDGLPGRFRRAVPDSKIVDKAFAIFDVGAHKMWIARHYHCHEPDTCLIPNGFCSMGFALPGAIAGDGGFLMNVREMETARRLDRNIVVMVWEDGGYGLIAWQQDTHFGRQTDLSFGNPDWMTLATLQKTFDEPGPSLVVVSIDCRGNGILARKLGEITSGL